MSDSNQPEKKSIKIKQLIDFYKTLAKTTFLFSTPGTKSMCNIDSYLFSSIQNTLGSIQTILDEGKINDAYALLRKYSDSVVINIYTNLYLEDETSFEKIISRKSYVVAKIDSWLNGKDKLPKLSEMLKYIAQSKKADPITSIIDPSTEYRRLRDRCNDHTHYNFFYYVMLNDPEIYLKGRKRALEQFKEDLREMFIWHLAYMFYTQPHYMMSSDYRDYLDFGMTPEPDSQFWVAGFIQKIFDDILAKFRPDIADVIKRDSPMHIS